jgi:hypothetical protein
VVATSTARTRKTRTKAVRLVGRNAAGLWLCEVAGGHTDAFEHAGHVLVYVAHIQQTFCSSVERAHVWTKVAPVSLSRTS